MSRSAAFLALALSMAGTAAAQSQVYRCGADGRSYSQEPCAQGRAVDVADPRSAQQATQTRQAALHDAREADALERARLRAERQAASQGPALIGWSKSAASNDRRCGKGTACKSNEASKSRPTTQAVTQYRGAASR